jgi:hypothetical protein
MTTRPQAFSRSRPRALRHNLTAKALFLIYFYRTPHYSIAGMQKKNGIPAAIKFHLGKR